MKHELKQQFQKSDRLNNKIEEKLPLKCQILNDTERSEFARDRDRILFSRPFRRLQHKAQVFSNEKGDHYRTRLTHTLEVCQISRSLARYLDANEDLAEAIALGHDIGHAPFGHQGERVLDEVMSGEDNLGLIKYPLNLGGFNHNYNSIRILDVVQSKYENYEGLNLSWQVLEGILKHTKTKSKWDIKRFVNNESLIGKLHLDSKFSVTLEGQIVEVADEIAQRQHDIDDGLRNKELDIQEKVLYEKIINEVDQIISTKYQYNNFDREYLDKLCDLIIRLKESLLKSKKSESKLIRQDNLVRNMIEYFILDVFANSRRNILKMSKLNKYNERNLLETKVVDLSPFGKELNEKIEKLVNYKILNSYDVNKFDGKSRFVVRQLFKAYYTNPLQMPSYALKRLENKLRSNSKLYCMSLQNDDNAINFNDVNYTQLSRSDVIALNNSLKMEDLTKLNLTPAIFKMNQENLRNDVFYEHLKAINNTENNEITTIKDKCLKCLVENHYAYLSTICDYISGMSDNYANNQYKNLYLVE